MKKFLPLLIGFFLIITSCSVQKGTTSSSANQPNALKAQWILVNEATGKAFEGLQDKPVTIEFDSDNMQLMGFGGCNQYGGKYSTNGNTIALEDLYSTKMACPDMDAEDKYFSLLEDVNRYEIKANELKLYKDQILLLKFKK